MVHPLPRYEHRLVERRMVWPVSLASGGHRKVDWRRSLSKVVEGRGWSTLLGRVLEGARWSDSYSEGAFRGGRGGGGEGGGSGGGLGRYVHVAW